ncbi:MAG: choice-of-anchor E domain-containing protein [Verrucomicrobia bacterium]|nr:choice-of-anchor E domain-containing protein [Verrucomicrobiota bacterium]
MKIIPALLTLTFAFSTALTCRADVISQTVDFGTITSGSQFYFNQFNTALGTLTGVTLDWTVNSSISSASVTNMNSGSVTVNKIVFTNTVDGYLPSVGDTGNLAEEGTKTKTVTPGGTVGSRTLTTGQSYNLSNIALGTLTDSNSYAPGDADFNSFKGTGTVPLYITNTFGATVTASGSGVTNSWLTSITGTSTGNLQVTYEYTAAPIAPVPEPPSLLLGFGGILGMAGFAFKRRAKNTAAALA